MSNVFHIGLPKTASSFLQKRVFPALSNYEFQTTYGNSLDNRFRWVYEINSPFHDERLPHSIRMRKIRKCSSALKDLQEPAIVGSERSRNNLIVSSEGLAGVSYDPLINNDLIVKRIAEENASARIIVCLRRQDDWCESIYKQLVFRENRFGRHISFDSFASVSPLANALMYCGNLQWDVLVKNCFDQFGRENVCVLLYEDLLREPQHFVGTLLKFLDSSDLPHLDLTERINTMPKELIYKPTSFAKKLCAIAKSAATRKDRFFHETRTLLPCIRANLKRQDLTFQGLDQSKRREILAAVFNSNRNLAEMLDTDLGQYGYY